MITRRDGWWWPAVDEEGRRAVTRDVDADVESMLAHTEGRTCIIQAGGNVGVYALALAPHFRRVITAEPDRTNIECLWKNIHERDTYGRVDARMAAFGQDDGDCRVEVVALNNCGAHRIEPGGVVPMLTIDGLGLLACDAIWLDVEGYELFALQGSVETLERWNPTLRVECKGLDAQYGVRPGELQSWIVGLGYREVEQVGNDRIYRRSR